MVWLDTSKLPTAAEATSHTSIFNKCEAALCLAVANELVELGLAAADVGVTSPYAAQVHLCSLQVCFLAKLLNGFLTRVA